MERQSLEESLQSRPTTPLGLPSFYRRYHCSGVLLLLHKRHNISPPFCPSHVSCVGKVDEFLTLCLQHNIMIQAQNISGKLNVWANHVSRQIPSLTERNLYPSIYRHMFLRWGMPSLYLFATRETCKCRFCVLLSDKLAYMVCPHDELVSYLFLCLSNIREDGGHFNVICFKFAILTVVPQTSVFSGNNPIFSTWLEKPLHIAEADSHAPVVEVLRFDTCMCNAITPSVRLFWLGCVDSPLYKERVTGRSSSSWYAVSIPSIPLLNYPNFLLKFLMTSSFSTLLYL